MKKTNPSQTIQLQLQKLNKIMEQQHQFNNKHIIDIIKSASKDQNSIFQSASSFSDLDETQINMRSKEGHLIDICSRESMIRDQVLMNDIENYEITKIQQQPCQDLLLSFIDQQKNTVVIENRSNYTQSQTQTLKWERKNYFCKGANNKNIQNQSQAEIELISNYQESAAPTETVGISVEKTTHKIKNQIKKDKFRDRDKLGYFNFSDEVLSKTYIKNAHNYNANLQANSKTYTHTIKPSQAILLTNSNAQAKKNVNTKTKVQKQKSKIKRPLTNAKLFGLKSEKNCDFPILFTQGVTQSAKKVQKTDKQPQKAKQKQLIYLYGEKTAQNRRPKTKRAENINQTLDNKVIIGGSMMKKKQASYNYDQQALKSSASNASGGKKWLKNNDKSAKKLNKLPVNRIQQSMQSKKQCSITNNKDSKLKFNNHQSREQNKEELEELRKSEIENQHIVKMQFPEKLSAKTGQKPMHIIQRLNFQNKPKDQDPKLIEQLIRIKNLYKSYNIITNNYRQGVRKINGKYLKLLALQIQNISDHAIYKMKILTAIVVFFSQFFKISAKNIMGMIAKSQLQSHKQFHIQKSHKRNSEELKHNTHPDYPQKELLQINNFQVSQDTLILSLLDKPKVLINIMQTMPFLLTAKRELSKSFVDKLLQSYEQINLQIDKELSLELFLVKKTKIFNYYHELVQLIKFLLTNQLVATVKTLQIEQDNYENRQQWRGYYSSRSKGQKYDKNNKKQVKNPCHQKQFDSERRVNVEQIFTDRITKLEERNLFVRNNVGKKQNKKADDYKENMDKKWAMQKQSALTVSRQKNKNKNKKDAKLS